MSIKVYSLLRQKKKLEIDKHEIISCLSNIIKINFNNINDYKFNNINNESLINFLNFIRENKSYGMHDKIIYGIDYNINILNLAKNGLDIISNKMLIIRGLAIEMSNIISVDKRNNIYSKIINLFKNINTIYFELNFSNNMIYNHIWEANYNFSLCEKLSFIIFPLEPNIDCEIENRSNWSLNEWIENINSDMNNYGTFSIIINLLNVFKIKYENDNSLSNLLIDIINSINKIISYENNKIKIYYDEHNFYIKKISLEYKTLEDCLISKRNYTCKSLESCLFEIGQQINTINYLIK